MIYLFLLAMASIFIILLWKYLIILRTPINPKEKKTIWVGNHDKLTSANVEIPKIIWSYWQQTPTPTFVEQCRNNWAEFAPDHEIRMLSKETILEWIDPALISEKFDSLPPYRQADWLRLQLLARYGGVWVDASIIFTENLQWLHDLQQLKNSEYAGFYLDGFTKRKEQPIVENWFMASTIGSQFITDLIAEFDIALALGEAEYLDQLRKQGFHEKVVQGITISLQQYLIMHVAASAIIDRHPQSYRLALLCAEDTAMVFHQALNWRKRHLYVKLALCGCPQNLPAIVKLRGSERKLFQRYLSRNWLYSKSFIAKHLK